MSKQMASLVSDKEYSDILQQAIIELHTARTIVARQVNGTVNSAY